MFNIEEEPKGNKYKNLIEYALSKSDAIMFVVRRDRYIYWADYKIIKKISNMLNITTEEFAKNYKDYIHNNYDKIYANINNILEDRLGRQDIDKYIKFLQKSHKISVRLKEDIQLEIDTKVKFHVYEKSILEIKKKLSKYLIKERHNPEWAGSKVIVNDKIKEDLYKYNNQYIFDICFYKNSDEIKRFLIESVDSLYKFNPPYLPEDISFFKEGHCWLKTVTHENMCVINIESKEEYDNLTNIGIKMEDYNEKYVNGDMWYEEY